MRVLALFHVRFHLLDELASLPLEDLHIFILLLHGLPSSDFVLDFLQGV